MNWNNSCQLTYFCFVFIYLVSLFWSLARWSLRKWVWLNCPGCCRVNSSWCSFIGVFLVWFTVFGLQLLTFVTCDDLSRITWSGCYFSLSRWSVGFSLKISSFIRELGGECIFILQVNAIEFNMISEASRSHTATRTDSKIPSEP